MFVCPERREPTSKTKKLEPGLFQNTPHISSTGKTQTPPLFHFRFLSPIALSPTFPIKPYTFPPPSSTFSSTHKRAFLLIFIFVPHSCSPQAACHHEHGRSDSGQRWPWMDTAGCRIRDPSCVLTAKGAPVRRHHWDWRGLSHPFVSQIATRVCSSAAGRGDTTAALGANDRATLATSHQRVKAASYD